LDRFEKEKKYLKKIKNENNNKITTKKTRRIEIFDKYWE